VNISLLDLAVAPRFDPLVRLLVQIANRAGTDPALQAFLAAFRGEEIISKRISPP
jgi:hypothetical protein